MEPIELRSDSRSKVISASPGEVYAAISDPERLARWWGPAGFTNTIHKFDFVPGGQWLLTMHGPDGKSYPNESRIVRVEPGRAFEIEHLSGHHFFLSLELSAEPAGTQVHWRQTFDTVEHYARIAEFVARANEENLERLAREVVARRPLVLPPDPAASGDMTAYREAFHVDASSSMGRLRAAARMLAEGTGTVVLDRCLALRPTAGMLLCEVIDSTSAVHRCDHEYEVMVENARRALEASPLFPTLPGLPRTWVVVEEHGTGTVVQWREP